jgi:hypothetical protein
MVMVKKDMAAKAKPALPERHPPGQPKYIKEMESLHDSLLQLSEEPQDKEADKDEDNKEMNVTGNIHTDHISSYSSISHSPQPTYNCSEEVSDLAKELEANDDNALDKEN